MAQFQNVHAVPVRTAGRALHWAHPSLPACPICLTDRMVCPRMTPCGPSFCWPCLLHNLHEGEGKWKPCPICFEPLSKKDLKILLFHFNEAPGVGRDPDPDVPPVGDPGRVPLQWMRKLPVRVRVCARTQRPVGNTRGRVAHP